MGNLPDIFKDFPGLIKQNSKTFRKSKKNPGFFQDVATLHFDRVVCTKSAKN